ncbi:Hypothetical protein SCLAV_1293 [Streptomyces clavuligerus]|uniref:Uncharacterized protein n=1 Tax=Streptomyces clavuligerus TaxID=1901 RepID=B5GXP9_STRCL|nr:hypothetical protein SSCG_03972 [Streptomyces clavuligerus]EFG06372.1 Hypothetical protein SCLAV_1293 [Streptomyces clavuligerus]
MNTPNLPFFFSPYVISRCADHPGGRERCSGVNSRTPPGWWEHSHRSAGPGVRLSEAR